MQVSRVPWFDMYDLTHIDMSKGRGVERSRLLVKSMARTDSLGYSKVTLRPYSAYFRTRPLSSWRTTR